MNLFLKKLAASPLPWLKGNDSTSGIAISSIWLSVAFGVGLMVNSGIGPVTTCLVGISGFICATVASNNISNRRD